MDNAKKFVYIQQLINSGKIEVDIKTGTVYRRTRKGEWVEDEGNTTPYSRFTTYRFFHQEKQFTINKPTLIWFADCRQLPDNFTLDFFDQNSENCSITNLYLRESRKPTFNTERAAKKLITVKKLILKYDRRIRELKEQKAELEKKL